MPTTWMDRIAADNLRARFGDEEALEVAVRELNRSNASEDRERSRAWGGIVAVLLYAQEKRLVAA